MCGSIQHTQTNANSIFFSLILCCCEQEQIFKSFFHIRCFSMAIALRIFDLRDMQSVLFVVGDSQSLSMLYINGCPNTSVHYCSVKTAVFTSPKASFWGTCSAASAANYSEAESETTAKCHVAHWFGGLITDGTTSKARRARRLLAGCHWVSAEGTSAGQSEGKGRITCNKEAKRQ